MSAGSPYNNMDDDDNPSNKKNGSSSGNQNNKGDVSQQIMDAHGSRVKKYGIYID